MEWVQWFIELAQYAPYGILFGFSIGGQASKSSSQQSSALQPYLSTFGPNTAAAVNNLSTTGFNLAMDTPNPVIDPNTGLAPSAAPAVDSMVRLALNQSSGDYGARGYVSPENRAAVAGSAIQNTLPSMLPQIQSYAQYAQQFPFAKLAAAEGAVGPGISAAGGQGTSSADSFGFGLSVANGSPGGGGGNKST